MQDLGWCGVGMVGLERVAACGRAERVASAQGYGAVVRGNPLGNDGPRRLQDPALEASKRCLRQPDYSSFPRNYLEIRKPPPFSTVTHSLTHSHIPTHTSMPAMSDDDSLADGVSIETNPFTRDILTDEMIAYYNKMHRENPHPSCRGPPLTSARPVRSLSPAQKRKNPRLLDGIGPIPFYQGLGRRPDGQVYSHRLEILRQYRTPAPPAATEARPPLRRRPPPNPAPAASGPSNTGRVQKKTGPRRPRRKTPAAKRAT